MDGSWWAPRASNPYVGRLIPSEVGSIPTRSRQTFLSSGGVERVKALALLSGGLDSILAARLVAAQGIEVVGVSFVSPFFDAASAQKAAAEAGIELVVIDLSEDILELLRGPKHGFGRHVNPCIDCHALMVRRAATKMEELGASFVVTGEVVGQRPKSQMRFGLEVVERESRLKGYLLRPLSARLLSPTVPEESGWIDREKLLGLHGRTRKPQMELASEFGITHYASPAGGCLLTDENYSRGIRDLIDHGGLSVADVRLLSVGRQFRLSERAKLVVGRNHGENEALFGLAPPGSKLVKTVDKKGPVAVLAGEPNDEDFELAAGVVARYADTSKDEVVRVHIWTDDGSSTECNVTPLRPRSVRELAI
jgi:tRNA-specific 2-thiouridylase